MDSSSSSSSNPQWKYDVFINCRRINGSCETFVSRLYHALSKAGIETYNDHQLDRKTCELGQELLEAIEKSHISIVVFSIDYTESSWCLNELLKIMECYKTHGQMVIPVFNDINAKLITKWLQQGCFKEAFRYAAETMDLYKEEDDEKMEYLVSSWTKAFTDATKLPGLDATFRNEAELVQGIVEDVLRKLKIELLFVTKFPVGSRTHDRVQQVIEFIKTQSSKVCLIGIWGMGGSGKTTTAKIIYNQINCSFENKSFIENIREVCENNNRGIIHLQQQLLSDILNSNEMVHTIASGTTMIERRFEGKRALIVLDDVTTIKQFETLLRNHTLFHSGSVVIVTTRNLRILKLLEVDHVLTMETMGENESLNLFSWHAFRQPNPKEGFIELSMSVVDYCGGLPLALEVLGSYLYKNTKDEWISLLSKLKRIPNVQVQEKLRISYDDLEDDMEKNIFLDICCFFIGKDKNDVTTILNGCGYYAEIGMHVLIERSLIKIEKNNKLGMHDLIRDMGREIIRESSAKEPGRRSRLWFHNDVHDVLTKNIGTETVEGLVLQSQITDKVCYSTDSFKKMKKLKLLQLHHVELNGPHGNLSEELRWVHWKGLFTCNYIPDDFHQENIVVINIKYSNIEKVWKETKVLVNLKILNLSHSKYLERTPDFSKLPNLEKLVLKDCPRLYEIHPSIGDLNNILLINLKDCRGLINLPKKIYQLKSLKTLIVSSWTKLEKLEKDIEQWNP